MRSSVIALVGMFVSKVLNILMKIALSREKGVSSCRT